VSRQPSKNQVTIPARLVREAGLASGDEVEAQVLASGRLEITRADDLVERFAGRISGVYPPGCLDALRDEWER